MTIGFDEKEKEDKSVHKCSQITKR